MTYFLGSLKTLQTMIKTVEELKELILWAREQRIADLQIAEVKVTFSPLAFVDAVAAQSDAEMSQVLKGSAGEQDNDDEELLFHSAR